MSPRATVPLTSDISAALAMFFHGGAGPSHTTITTVLTGSGYGDNYVYNPNAQGTNKQQRVLTALSPLTKWERSAWRRESYDRRLLLFWIWPLLHRQGTFRWKRYP